MTSEIEVRCVDRESHRTSGIRFTREWRRVGLHQLSESQVQAIHDCPILEVRAADGAGQ